MVAILSRPQCVNLSSPGACPTKYRIDQIRSNSNFAWNSYRCAFEDSQPIITKFGTRHDSRTVVTCTKFRYDRPTIIEIRGTRIFGKFWIQSNLSIRYLVGQAPGNSIYWPCRINRSLSSMRKDFQLCPISLMRNDRKCKYIYVSKNIFSMTRVKRTRYIITLFPHTLASSWLNMLVSAEESMLPNVSTAAETNTTNPRYT